ISFLRWFAFAGPCVALSWCREVAGVCAGSISLPFEMRRRYELFSLWVVACFLTAHHFGVRVDNFLRHFLPRRRDHELWQADRPHRAREEAARVEPLDRWT